MLTRDHTFAIVPHAEGFEVIHSFVRKDAPKKRKYQRAVFSTKEAAEAARDEARNYFCGY